MVVVDLNWTGELNVSLERNEVLSKESQRKKVLFFIRLT